MTADDDGRRAANLRRSAAVCPDPERRRMMLWLAAELTGGRRRFPPSPATFAQVTQRALLEHHLPATAGPSLAAGEE